FCPGECEASVWISRACATDALERRSKEAAQRCVRTSRNGTCREKEAGLPMRGDNEDWSADPFVQTQLSRIDHIIRRLLRRLSWNPNSEIAGDCRQNAKLALWRARDRLAALPDAERQKYVGALIGHAAWRVLKDEFLLRQQTPYLEE